MKNTILASLLLSAATAVGGTNSFTVGCVNCGAFHYGKGRATKAAFCAEWKRLAADWPQDVFFYEDVGKDPQRMPGRHAMPKFDIRAESRATPAKVDEVPMPRTVEVDGVERKTPRFRALRLVFERDGRSLAVYGVHLVAEGHIPKGKARSEGSAKSPSHSQRLRQSQFRALIEDAKKFDLAILTGDFNAQKPWEYDIFKDAGFAIANCSAAYGEQATLRDIPADNIILSPGISFVDFRVLKDYVLDTDHFPLVATVRIEDATK